MKIRNDFVTNSSSSSYVIAYSNPIALDPEALSKYPALAILNDLVHMVLFWKSEYTEAGDLVDTKDCLEYCIRELFCYDADDEDNELDEILEKDSNLKGIYNKALQAINSGKRVLFKNIAYADDAISNIIRTLSESDLGIEIIYKD